VVAQAVVAKSMFTVNSITDDICKLQKHACKKRTGQEHHFVLVCTYCATWRSKAPITGLSRGTVGIQVNLPLGNGVVCNACKQVEGICAVNLVGRVIRIRPRGDSPSVHVSLCTMCASPNSGLERKGDHWLCKKCTKGEKYMTMFNGANCFFCSASRISSTFSCLYNSSPVTVSTCSFHKPNIPGLHSVDVSAVRRMVLSRRPRYITTKKW